MSFCRCLSWQRVFYLFIIVSPGSFCLLVRQVFIRLYCHQTILDFVQHRQSTFYPPNLQRLPLQFFQHLIYTASPLIVPKAKPCSFSLNSFQLINLCYLVWVPGHRSRIPIVVSLRFCKLEFSLLSDRTKDFSWGIPRYEMLWRQCCPHDSPMIIYCPKLPLNMVVMWYVGGLARRKHILLSEGFSCLISSRLST